jgi:transcriptional regulator with XRE-family HTH domain
MLDATEFGKILRELMAKNNLRQEQLAKELEVSPSILSNYITGKNIPEMDFLAKCMHKFDLKNNSLDIADFFYKAFLSSAANNQKVIIDTRFFDSTRIGMLVKIITVSLLFPQLPRNISGTIEILENIINEYYNMLKTETEFHAYSF